jgi:hypothetical protein
VCVLVLGCDLPRDPEGTLKRVRGGVLRVGAIDEPPWIAWGDRSEPQGVEADLVRRLADLLQARIEWTKGSEQTLFQALEHYELDLVVGGLTADSPRQDQAGFSKPYFVANDGRLSFLPSSDRDKHVWAVPPGENAWLNFIERQLDPSRQEIAERVAHARQGRPR